MTYTARKPPLPETADQLRARVPGWGADLDPADRPAVPREVRSADRWGAHWDLPEQQPETVPRERSVEHERLTPVFGTACPPRLLSGRIRRLAYRRWSEGRSIHWLALVLADRVDAVESTVASFGTRRPDNLLAETGVRAELRARPVAARRAGSRVDAGHHLLDPVLVGAPWLLAGGGLALAGRSVVRGVRRLRAG